MDGERRCAVRRSRREGLPPSPRYPPAMPARTIPGPDSPIKQAMYDLRDGKRTFEDVLKFLVGWKWVAPEEPEGKFTDPQWWTSIENRAFLPSTPGSWDEVEEAAALGFLTEKQMDAVYDAVVGPHLKKDASAT